MRAHYTREYYAPEISSIEQWRETRWRELNTRRYQVFHDSFPSLRPTPFTVALSERWNSRYNVSRQVIIRISNREIAIYSWCAGHGAKRGRKATEREREKARNREDWRADVTIWLPRIHYGQNYQVITALVAKMRRLYTNANECESVSGLTMSLSLSFSRLRKGRAKNFVIVGTEDSNATKDVLAFEIRRWLFSMLTSSLLKIRSPVKIE